MKPRLKVAALITCHNRKEKTISALTGLFSSTVDQDVQIECWLVDDGSTDETNKQVKASFPQVHVIVADGSLFWCGGMRLAWDNAAQSEPDVYLWLNDDVKLLEGALTTLIETHRVHPDSIVIGSCADPVTCEHSYGGQKRLGAHPAKLAAVHPSDVPVECDTFEGNIVLVPERVYRKVGNMGRYHHAMADTDYGLRAGRLGVRTIIAPGHIGLCERNHNDRAWEAPTIGIQERWRRIVSRKGLPPNDWFKFCFRNGGLFFPVYFAGPYVRLLLQSFKKNPSAHES
jgi:GT2 family glycosyltransferase